MAKVMITEEMCIAVVIERFPATEPVFKKFFGEGCFSCPGSKNEDISFGAMMHNVELATVLKELNNAVTK
jgi:hybrid cluster-associated redox disulfide protein